MIKKLNKCIRMVVLAPLAVFMGVGSNESANNSRPLNAQERYDSLAGALGAMSGQTPTFGLDGKVKNPSNIINSATSAINALGNYDAPTYNSASFTNPGAAQTSAISDSGAALRMANGDYGRLEQQILESRTAPLQYALAQAQNKVNEDAANRGIWSSGLAMRSQNDLADRFAPELRAAAADAATQRYNMQAADLANTNSYNLGRANNMNTANLGSNSMVNSYNLTNANNMNQLAQTDAAQKNSFEMENASRKYNAQWAPANFLKDAYNGTGGTISNGSASGWNFSL